MHQEHDHEPTTSTTTTHPKNRVYLNVLDGGVRLLIGFVELLDVVRKSRLRRCRRLLRRREARLRLLQAQPDGSLQVVDARVEGIANFVDAIAHLSRVGRHRLEKTFLQSLQTLFVSVGRVCDSFFLSPP